MSLSLLLQQCSTYLVILGGFVRWKVAGRTAVVLYGATSRICLKQQVAFLCCSHIVFFSIHFVRIQLVHPYSSIDTATAWKKSYFILSGRSDFHMIDNLSIIVHTFSMCILTSLSVDEILLLWYVN